QEASAMRAGATRRRDAIKWHCCSGVDVNTRGTAAASPRAHRPMIGVYVGAAMRRFLLRLEPDLATRLAAATATLRAHRPGGIVSHSSVLRELLHAALDDPRIVRSAAIARAASSGDGMTARLDDVTAPAARRSQPVSGGCSPDRAGHGAGGRRARRRP